MGDERYVFFWECKNTKWGRSCGVSRGFNKGVEFAANTLPFEIAACGEGIRCIYSYSFLLADRLQGISTMQFFLPHCYVAKTHGLRAGLRIKIGGRKQGRGRK